MDYFNEYSAKFQYYIVLRGDMGEEAATKALMDMLVKDYIQRYEERFFEDRDLIDWSNPRLKKINQVAMHVTLSAIEKRLTVADFIAAAEEVHGLIYGHKRNLRELLH